MGNLGPLPTISTFALISATALITGCSNPREDVRVTLCKDIVLTQLGSSAEVSGADTQIKGREQAAVTVRFSTGDRQARATCYYDYDAVDETALQLSDPLSGFSTSPSGAVIDGRKLSRSGLAEAVKQAMLKQGGEFVDRAKKGLESALQR